MMYNATSSNSISVLVAFVVALITYFGPYWVIMKKLSDIF